MTSLTPSPTTPPSPTVSQAPRLPGSPCQASGPSRRVSAQRVQEPVVAHSPTPSVTLSPSSLLLPWHRTRSSGTGPPSIPQPAPSHASVSPAQAGVPRIPVFTNVRLPPPASSPHSSSRSPHLVHGQVLWRSSLQGFLKKHKQKKPTYLFERQNAVKRESSICCFNGHSGHAGGHVLHPGFSRGSRAPSTWAILVREQRADGKWSSQDANLCSSRGIWCLLQ